MAWLPAERRPPAGRRASVRRFAWVAGAAVAAGLAVLTPAGSNLEEAFGLDLLFRLRGPTPPPGGVAIVAIDQAAAAKLGLPSPPRVWPRAVHARLIDTLGKSGAVTVVMDVLFSEKGRVEDDGDLTAALRSAGNVVLLEGLTRTISGTADRPEAIVDETIEPIDDFAGAAAATAPFPLPKRPARVTRSWTFWSGRENPTLASVALQLSARDIVRDWAALLAAEPGLPGDPEAWSAQRMQNSMVDLHRRLRSDAATADRLRQRIGAFPSAEARRLAALLSLYVGDDSRLLDLRGPAGTFTTVNYASLISGTSEERAAAAADLAGKVVFVGADERAGTQQVDAHDTVFSGENGIQLTGVEILATAYADLADGTTLDATTIDALCFIGAIGLALGLAGATGNAAVVLTVAVLLPVAVIGAALSAFAWMSTVLPVAVPIGIEIPVGIVAAIWRLRSEARWQLGLIDAAIREHLPEDLVRLLTDGPLAAKAVPRGEIRYAACLATDIERFTSLSERLTPTVLAELMNDYFRPLFAIVQNHRGLIDSVSGDGMMCVWPTAGEEAGARRAAAAAAIEMQVAVAEFNDAHPQTPLPTRFGLHAGVVVLGAVGGAGHYVSTVVGDVANTASRIEGLSKHLGTQILSSKEALRRVDGLVLRPLGDFVLVGKSQPLEIVEVLGRAGADEAKAALGDAFAAALEAYRERRWKDAADRLERLQRDHPNDGPTAFFLRRTAEFMRTPPELDEILVRMSTK